MNKTNIIDAESAWKIIINELNQKEREFHTVPKTKKEPVWFAAKSDGKNIYIDKARIHKPSSKITSIRVLKLDNFLKVYPLAIKREQGESVSSEVTKTTVNQVYYFSLIKNFIFDK